MTDEDKIKQMLMSNEGNNRLVGIDLSKSVLNWSLFESVQYFIAYLFFNHDFKTQTSIEVFELWNEKLILKCDWEGTDDGYASLAYILIIGDKEIFKYFPTLRTSDEHIIFLLTSCICKEIEKN